MKKSYAKRVLCLLLMICACFTLAACDDKEEDNQPGTVTEVNMLTQEQYDSLPDETIYNEDGGIVATGKDLIAYESVTP